MSIWKRGNTYYIDVRWRDMPRLQLSTGTGNKALAREMESTLRRLYRENRSDLLGLLKLKRVTLRQLHEAVVKGPKAVQVLRIQAESLELSPLVDEWLHWMKSANGLSLRTRRRYADQTVRRYRVSWEGFFEILPKGRDAKLSHLTDGFVADYKRTRVRAEGGSARNSKKEGKTLSAATINRDLVALGAFFTWCEQIKGLTVQRPSLRREREPQGRERWLSQDEVRAVETACPTEWWPLFAALLYTGMRVGEAQGMRGEDVRLTERRMIIHEGMRRVKSPSSVRHVPIPEPLAAVLAEHFARTPCGPSELVFRAPLSDYGKARRVWRKVCLQAGLHDGGKKPKPTATLHDLRHSFGVHAAQSGVPVVRLQKLLGHATPHMTLRYMQHAPEAYFAEDAARIAASLSGAAPDREAATRSELAREQLKSV